jgi:hypothetical protein
MPDPTAPAPAASPVPSPAEAVAQITAAKAISGMAFRQTAERLDALGMLPFAERELLASLRRTVPGTPVDDAMRLGGLSAADARTQTQGDALMRAGRTLEETRETIGDLTFEPDDRTEAQREYDRQHNVTPTIDPRSYNAPVPPGETSVSWEPVAADARSFAGDLGFTPEAGSAFIRTIIAAGSEIGHAADPGMVRQKWEQTLAAVFPGDKLPEAVARVDALLKDYAGSSPLAAKLRSQGLAAPSRIARQA